MSEFNFDQFYQSLRNATTREAVDAIFKDVFALPAAERDVVGKELEKKFLHFSRLRSVVLTEGIAAAEESVRENSWITPMNPDYDDDLAHKQKLLQTRVNVAKLRGENASPLSKAFNAAATTLTAEELKSSAVYAKPLLAVVKAIAKQEGLSK
jgi:hypothetical protein